MAEPAAPPAEAPAPAEDATKKPIDVHAWARIDGRLQGVKDPKKMDHLSSSGVVELHTSGSITDEIALTANFAASYPSGTAATGIDGNGTVEILDLIGQFDIAEPFHVWAGRMLVPVDRANFSGSWFASPWYYPGFFGGIAAAPAEGPAGRNDGVTVWGQVEGGMFKYYAGAFDLHDTTKKPLWSGRLNLSLINPEPGYYHSSTYYGGKDIVAIGVGAQMRADGSMPPMGAPASIKPDDYAEVNFDILAEKNLEGSGVITGEAAFYKYIGDNEPFKYSYLILASYLTPEKVGPGKVQPLVRLQQAKPQAGSSATSVEGQIGYVIADYAARLALGYQYTKVGPVKGNAIYLGAQFLK